MAISLDGTTGIQTPSAQLVGSTSGVVTLTGAATAGTWSFTMPTNPGTAGYVLQTDGLGGTSWSPAGAGGSVSVYDEGSLLTSAVTSFNFTGAGVTATAVGNAVTVSISGGGGGSGSYTRTTYTATAGQTTFSATYTVNYVEVYLNGILLNGADYTATSGTSIVLAVAAAVGDIVDIVAFNITGFTGGVTITGTPASGQLTSWTGATSVQGVDSFPIWQSVQTGNFTAVAGRAYPVDTTSGAVTVTLPASPTAGQIVQITDYAGTFATNNCTVNPNGGKINASTSNAVLRFSTESVSLVYIDSTKGWLPYSGFQVSPLLYSVAYLVVAGGAGGGTGPGGGGGAGGLLSANALLNTGTTYSITVGAGGAAAAGTYPSASANAGSNGSNSVFGSFAIATGGGGGGGAGAGVSGGSGGGGAGSGVGGSGTSGQGNVGGLGQSSAGEGAGGGGAGAAGTATQTTGYAGNGGVGLSSSITGSAVFYAGGGGGGGNSGGAPAGSSNHGTGGTGGGGDGGWSSTLAAIAGTANRGGGGGGGGRLSGTNNYAAAAGGSGVVILSIPTVNYTGTTTGSPTVTTNGSNTVLTFTASGSYTA